ncbi:hypothetical protein D9M68_955100 [compost metagenome]
MNPEPSATTMTQLLRLVSSGILEAEATTDIEGVPLRHVFVNALVTKRVSQFIDQSKVVGPGERKYV